MNVFRGSQKVAITLTGMLAAVALCGCAQTGNDDADTGFEGPWAAEFQANFQAAKSDFVRDVLRDGTITDQEFSEMSEQFTSCLAGSGITFAGFNDDGSYDTSFAPGAVTPDQAHDRMNSCSAETGEDLIGSLYSWLQRNPERLDEPTIMASCLVQAGVVDAGYTAKDYAKDVPTEAFPFIDVKKGADALVTCEADPLGLLSTH
ncbi:hypothetical protein [Compostimonas suwonensis]|uniref:Lipoprotein n=1 Tax=Compostimonas suwonensis TaxID=1048394 RepID=A0A2M9C009_9MICO|nr:hypothetical protein [Compostimonas suwonensis]PJJ63666.1 hypothetical protein CLV54_1337 [Compostimonas suwonensis]